MTGHTHTQIVVNVDGLTIEDKQRVGEALAKIKDKSSDLKVTNMRDVKWFYAASQIAWSYGDKSWPLLPTTHTPQQVLEMAGMAPSVEQDVILADTLIITDSSGNIIYDSTIHALNRLIEQRANSGKGWVLPDSDVSVKLDKNGMAVMVEKRKVREDFDATKEYSVNVSGCTVEEKKEVQQAFFDVGIKWENHSGIKWENHSEVYRHMDAEKYTNTRTTTGYVTTYLMYGTTKDCNMTAKEFLDLVYEPEQVGHVHSESMLLYAEDAKTHTEPWKLWQMKSVDGVWRECEAHPMWVSATEYRRKPKTKLIHGVEIPDIGLDLSKCEGRTDFYVPCVRSHKYYVGLAHHKHNNCIRFSQTGIAYPFTEEGKQAAILHAKAMLGMVQE